MKCQKCGGNSVRPEYDGETGGEWICQKCSKAESKCSCVPLKPSGGEAMSERTEQDIENYYLTHPGLHGTLF